MGFSSSLLLTVSTVFAFPTKLSHSFALSVCCTTHLSLPHQPFKAKDAALSHRGSSPCMRKRRPGATSKEPGRLESENEEVSKMAEWAKPGSDVAPPWAEDKGRTSTGQQQQQQQPFQPPFFLYLIGSVLVAIASVGSIFEFFNKRAVFGVIQPDNPFYTPLLGFFALTGLPTSAFLWYKSIVLANKLAEDQDKEDGFLDS